MSFSYPSRDPASLDWASVIASIDGERGCGSCGNLRTGEDMSPGLVIGRPDPGRWRTQQGMLLTKAQQRQLAGQGLGREGHKLESGKSIYSGGKISRQAFSHWRIIIDTRSE